MSWQTNSYTLALRNIGRASGLNNILSSLVPRTGYEKKYDAIFTSKLHLGDVVWDVGANIGHYTRIFSDHVGETGHIFSFEPSSLNFARLLKLCEHLTNVTLFPFGLGHKNGKYCFQQGDDELGATSRIVETESTEVSIDVQTGSEVITNQLAQLPNAIKIDVEGFEYEVLMGIEEYLTDKKIRLIGIEMHFGILKSRGLTKAPQQIENLLHKNGYTIKWPDSSHLIATLGD